MKKEITDKINDILKNINEIKQITANEISSDVMKGIFVVSKENQLIITTTTSIENLLNNLLAEKEDENIINLLNDKEVNTNDKNDLNNEKKTDKTEDITDNEEISNIFKDEDDNEDIEENIKEQKDESIENISEEIKEVYKEPEIIEESQNKKIEENISDKDKNNEEVEEENKDDDAEKINDIKAQIIGVDIPKKEEKLPYYGKIYNERRKASTDFIYNSYKIMATHYGFNASSDIFLYVAPLQIIKNNPNVPILVHAYCQGKYVTASSYDTKDNGHSIVQIEINDFNLLIRGGFDKDGKFISYVLTTGASANQGDKINIVSKQEGYTGTNPEGSGHIKFKEDNNVYEIFPLNTEENEYICIVISKEFLDYHVVANNYGAPKIKIFNNGKAQEIVAGWSGDYFEAGII